MRLTDHIPMIRVETIDPRNTGPIYPEKGRQGEKPQRFVPEIICGKIIDPGVDEENVSIHTYMVNTC
jgi:hypothetical protein